MTELPVTFGKYFLTEKLATGGMAEIYLGKLLGPGGFEKQLVIKQIHPRLAAERHFVDLFVAEAKTLVGLTHGNIVPVYELGIVDDTYFIAMEYIDGPTLWRFTESVHSAGETVAPAVAAWITSEILDGLDYAHRKGEGVIHRDLSPRNVMLSRDGQVLLVDFGIAIPFGAGDDPTADGAPTGSFPYMSPEQAERRPLTTGSDLFSVSVLLWEMLTGERLFARTSADATLDAVLHAPIPAPSAVRPGVPARLDEVVLRGLEREPAKRWPGAGEFLAALNRYLYSLEDVPGSRDLAALVARHCPPVVEHADDDAPRTQAVQTQERGPGTVVVPRRTGEVAQAAPVEGPATSRPAVREQSFATHVELERVFGATPLYPFPAIRDDDPAEATVARAPVETRPPPRQVDPPPRRWLPAAAIGMSIAALTAWLVLRSTPTSDGASTRRADARVAVTPVDAAVPDASPPPPIADAAPPIADAAVAPDAATRPPRDAGVRPVRDGGLPIDAAAATGIIKVGANPWGEVWIDRKKKGNAPNQWTVPAGRHEVVVVFPGEEGEERRTYQVDVSTGETESLFADFLK